MFVTDWPVVGAVTHEVQQAGAMLQDMLAEVVNGSDVAKALASLLKEETPTLAELRHGSKLSQAAVPLPATQHPDEDQTNVASNQDAAMADNGNHAEASSPHERVDASSPQEGKENCGKEGTVDRMLQQPDFQSFAEFVLDSACLSLLHESAAGKWQSPSERLSPR